MEPRTIEELLALYELEPALKDVFVEGPTDRAFVESVLRYAGLVNVQVNEIELVDIPDPVLARIATCSGKRQRVIALAIELERASASDLTRRVCCDADADEEAGRTPAVVGALLLYTDFTSVQLYAYSPDVLQRYLDLVVLGFPLRAEATLRLMEPVLREMALSRRVNDTLRLATAPVDATDDCEISDAAIVCDTARFTLRFLSKAAATHRRDEYLAEKRRLEALLPGDPRFWVHGEDFVHLLYWIIVRRRGAGSGRTVSRDLLGKALLLAVPFDVVVTKPLFVELRRRLS